MSYTETYKITDELLPRIWGIHERWPIMTTEDLGTLCICAIRYCHGRMSYMPDLVRRIVRENLSQISDKDLHVMIQDCGFQRQTEQYGDPLIDKPGWIKWEEELKSELKRREGGEK